MRVGDTYRINRMIQNGNTVEDILEQFKNDYTAVEIKRFIPKGTITADKKASVEEIVEEAVIEEEPPKPSNKPAKSNKKDPLG